MSASVFYKNMCVCVYESKNIIRVIPCRLRFSVSCRGQCGCVLVCIRRAAARGLIIIYHCDVGPFAFGRFAGSTPRYDIYIYVYTYIYFAWFFSQTVYPIEKFFVDPFFSPLLSCKFEWYRYLIGKVVVALLCVKYSVYLHRTVFCIFFLWKFLYF